MFPAKPCCFSIPARSDTFQSAALCCYHVDFPSEAAAPDGFFRWVGCPSSFTKSGIFPEFRDNHSRSVWLLFVCLIGNDPTIFEAACRNSLGTTTKSSGRVGAHGSQSKAC
jgi:hypothetical protein